MADRTGRLYSVALSTGDRIRPFTHRPDLHDPRLVLRNLVMDYSKTLNLPKTDFAMKANLPDREPPRLYRHWQEVDLYGQLMKRPAKGAFILHDGPPPYANGDIHMGHALNKTLKDFVVRSHAMMGFTTPYIPGWDCHGMPIENKVREQFREKKETPTLEGIRKACREYAAKWVETQKKEFVRLGVIGDWDHPYRTMDDHQVAREIRVFGELADKGFIYRGLKPVMWCIKDETALRGSRDRVCPITFRRPSTSASRSRKILMVSSPATFWTYRQRSVTRSSGPPRPGRSPPTRPWRSPRMRCTSS